MQPLVHPVYGFALPDVFARLVAHLKEGGRRRESRVSSALGVSGLASWVQHLVGLEVVVDEPELDYLGHPTEFITFAWQGGDALQYGLIVHADDPGLTHVAASYAPSDDGGAVWLGDDAEAGFTHLMAVELREVMEGGDNEAVNEVREAIDELANALGLTVVEAPDELTEGARSDREAEPRAPEGWLFEPCNDAIGVLAPAALFDADLKHPEGVLVFDLDAELELADSLLARGFAASSLAEARNTYHFVRLDEGDELKAAAARMRAAYDALGRPFLAKRVTNALERTGE